MPDGGSGAWLALAGLLASMGCQTPEVARRELDQEVFLYHRDLRWQRFPQAAKRLHPDLRDAFPETCCYQIELWAYKRTVVNCDYGYWPRKHSFYSLTVVV